MICSGSGDDSGDRSETAGQFDSVSRRQTLSTADKSWDVGGSQWMQLRDVGERFAFVAQLLRGLISH
ncbi:unnamed protein product [Soboliphyme baturini]|uniref:F5/8 type C domain-containing protein n=1 Tax=Soboliphyme baturini TaxID=241478 RepID=A0A183IBA8_9BILA|nr:unnamed protein product [Soboliphyme baturini]